MHMLDPLYYLIDLPSFDPATLDGIVLYCRLLSKVDRFRRQYDIFPGRVIITWVSRNSAGEVMVTAAPMPTSSERHRGRAATRQRGKSDAAECAKEVTSGCSITAASTALSCRWQSPQRTALGPPSPAALAATRLVSARG
jgi:hypothetical protein